ncbi:MAG: cation diffusion facilitator family transporter, partial [Candidatus Zixiibacteriota bacterium]
MILFYKSPHNVFLFKVPDARVLFSLEKEDFVFYNQEVADEEESLRDLIVVKTFKADMDANSFFQKEKKGVAFVSVLAAVFLVGIKLVVGVATGSLGILSEAAHSALDFGAALITYLAVRISGRPADSEHHYGHGKIESLSALAEIILLLATCFWIISEAIGRMFFRTVEVKVTSFSFMVMIIAIIVDYWRYKTLSRAARKYYSQALEADALHFSSDIYSSLVVIAGLIFTKIGFPVGDSIAALGVAIFVIIASYRLGKRTLDVLMDRAPQGLKQEIEKMVEKVQGVSECSRLRIRRSGPQVFVDMNISLDKNTTFEQAHLIASEVERKIRSVLPKTDIVVHTEPTAGFNFIDRKIDLTKKGEISPDLQAEFIIRETLNEHIQDFIEFHQLTFQRKLGLPLINLHLVLPKNIKIENAHELCDHLEEDIKKRLGESEIVIH